MDELGIIINQKGEAMSFGTWKKRDVRDVNNINDWHTDSFMNTVYPTKWFQDMSVTYDPNKEFQNQLHKIAKSGLVVIANSREDSETVGESRLVIVIPDTITEEQRNYLNSKKEDFIKFEDGHYSFIDFIDTNEDFEIIKELYNTTDFYNFLDTYKQEKHI